MENYKKLIFEWEEYRIEITRYDKKHCDLFAFTIKRGDDICNQHVQTVLHDEAIPNDDVLESSSPIPLDLAEAPYYGIYTI